MVTSNRERPTSSSTMSSTRLRDIDPLLKDLSEKKQSFRRNVASLAVELKEVSSRLALKEHTYAKGILTSQELEDKAKSMAEEISRLQKRLDERNEQLDASNSAAEKYLMELDNLKSHMSFTQATADASAASAESAQLKCIALLEELDEKNTSLKEQEGRVKRREEQLENLQEGLEKREFSQKQLREEVVRVEHDIMQALAKAEANQECEQRKISDEVSRKNLENMNKLLTSKDEEIARVKDEMKIMSAHWRFKTKELESQLKKHRKTDQKLKKRIFKLEFCLQEARSQTRELQGISERRDEAIKELRDQIAAKQDEVEASDQRGENPNFWESSSFKILASMSMLIWVVFSKA